MNLELLNTRYHSGTSGLDLPIRKTDFPPEFQGKSRLEYYASLFNSLEVNSIFYKLPRTATVANWAQLVPNNFLFTFKMSQCVTHVKELAFKQKDIDDFMMVVENAGEKKGCILVQFPPSLKIDQLDRFERLLESLGEAAHNYQWRMAIEFRDPSWYEREVYELLEEHSISLVMHDMARSATPINAPAGDFVYVRFHGPEPRYRGSYADAFLKQQSKRIKSWMNEGKEVFVYFNNTAGDAVNNLISLNKRLIS